MRTVGIRELKSQLSRVLRDVQRGERVLVTDRGRVVAELRQPLSPDSADARTPDARALLAATGQVRVGEPAPHAYAKSPIRSKAGLSRKLLDEERGEPEST